MSKTSLSTLNNPSFSAPLPESITDAQNDWLTGGWQSYGGPDGQGSVDEARYPSVSARSRSTAHESLLTLSYAYNLQAALKNLRNAQLPTLPLEL